MKEKEGIEIPDNGLGPICDMPKIHSPFKRKENENGDYVVYDEINPGYEWVFENDDVIAVEKMHGTNVSVIIKNGQIQQVFNRTNKVNPYGTFHHHNKIVRAVQNSNRKGWIDKKDGQWFGEAIGPGLHNNRHELDELMWYPFKKAQKSLRYKSWGKYPKTFDAISDWFESGLMSLLYSRRHGTDLTETTVDNGYFVEGVMFVHPDGRMAKLRRDMFEWYDGPEIH